MDHQPNDQNGGGPQHKTTRRQFKNSPPERHRRNPKASTRRNARERRLNLHQKRPRCVWLDAHHQNTKGCNNNRQRLERCQRITQQRKTNARREHGFCLDIGCCHREGFGLHGGQHQRRCQNLSYSSGQSKKPSRAVEQGWRLAQNGANHQQKQHRERQAVEKPHLCRANRADVLRQGALGRIAGGLRQSGNQRDRNPQNRHNTASKRQHHT